VDELTLVIEADELLGLNALLATAKADRSVAADSMARQLLRTALAARLDELALPWAPTAEQVAIRGQGSASTSPRAVPETSRWQRLKPRYGPWVLLIARATLVLAALIVLGGGYLGGWHWTGFQENQQLWDWLELLLLPIAFATLPLWLQYAEYMSRARRLSYAAVILGFAAFVVIGYLAPLGWTGNRGNTLWDWLQLVLLPIVFPTILAPAMLAFLTGNVAQRSADGSSRHRSVGSGERRRAGVRQ
jgi:hypothetical protein